jgi:hypothetical protein
MRCPITKSKRLKKDVLKLDYLNCINLYNFVSKMTNGGSPAWGLGEGITTTHPKNPACYMLHRASVEGSCEHGNEHSESIKGVEFLD